jgi:hypothetical protein
MTLADRARVHQLHPAKLAVDWTTAAVAGILLWNRQPLAAFAVGFLPSIAATAIFLTGRLDRALERIESRPAARTIARGLSADVNALRFSGLAAVWAGCWLHRVWPIPAGVAVILGAWALARRRGASDRATAGAGV